MTLADWLAQPVSTQVKIHAEVFTSLNMVWESRPSTKGSFIMHECEEIGVV
jgi:hypothetical protein